MTDRAWRRERRASVPGEDALFRALADTAPDPIVAADEANTIVYVNRAATETFGMPAERLLGSPLTVLMPERFHDAHRRGFDRYLETRRATLIGGTVEVFGVRADGTEFPLELSLAAWHQDDRLLFTAILRDITERKVAEQTRDAQLAVASALASADDPDRGQRILAGLAAAMGWALGTLWIPDADDDRLCVDATWAAPELDAEAFVRHTRELQLGRGEGLPGMAWQQSRPMAMEDVTRDGRFLRTAAALQAGLRGAIAVPLTVGGRVVGVLDFFSPSMRPPDERLAELMTALGAQIGEDLVRRQAQAAVQRLARELERSNTELERVAFVASHDLAEPLRVMYGFAELLERSAGDRLDDRERGFVEHIAKAAGRGLELVDALLEYARAGNSEPQRHRTDAGVVARKALEGLVVLLQETGAVVETVDPLPTVEADPVLLGQLFQNLLGNAITHAKRVWVTAEALEDEWCFTVADDGPGVPVADRERIFHLFAQGAGSGAGTGIGLATAQRIVESHGGRIWVDAAHTGGAAFHFTLPRQRP